MNTKKAIKPRSYHPEMRRLRENILAALKSEGMTVHGLVVKLSKLHPDRYRFNNVFVKKLGASVNKSGNHSPLEATEVCHIADILGVPVGDLFEGCG